jgi:Holliday junction resolvasome RuvABC DNA-binding subunit
MGYKRSEAEAAVGNAVGASEDDLEGLLRAALSALS